MPSPKRAVSTVPWWEVWASLTALVALGILLVRVLIEVPDQLTAIDAVLIVVAYLGVAVEMFRGLIRSPRR